MLSSLSMENRNPFTCIFIARSDNFLIIKITFLFQCISQKHAVLVLFLVVFIRILIISLDIWINKRIVCIHLGLASLVELWRGYTMGLHYVPTFIYFIHYFSNLFEPWNHLTLISSVTIEFGPVSFFLFISSSTDFNSDCNIWGISCFCLMQISRFRCRNILSA